MVLWGRVKSQTRPLFIRTPDRVRFQIFNSQKGKIPFGSPSFLHDFYANARYMPQYAYFLILFFLPVFVFTAIYFPSLTTTFFTFLMPLLES